MSRRLDEKHSRILTGLLKLPDNKKCFDCPSKVNVYANLFNSTFICERCSGLHRELNHRVKSISASTFTSEEVTGLQKGGNAVAKSIWLATWSWREYPEPDAHEVDEVRQFMRAKYVKKQWYRDPSGNNNNDNTNNNNNNNNSNAGTLGAAGAGVLSSHRPPSIESSSNASVSSILQQHPGPAKSQSIDSIGQSIATGPALAAAFSVVPERNLSRKSSTLSSDSGSTTFSKSTDPSSTGSSPFSPAVATNNGSGQKTTVAHHPSTSLSFQQQQAYYSKQPSHLHNTTSIQQYGVSALSMPSMTSAAASAASLGAFSDPVRGTGQPLMNQGSNPGSNGLAAAATGPSIDPSSDPFSLMTNSFSTMGFNNTSQSMYSNGAMPSSATATPSADIFGSLPMPMANSLVNSPAPDAGGGGGGGGDPFSLAGARLQQVSSQPYASPQQPDLGNIFTSAFSSPSVPAATMAMPTTNYYAATTLTTNTTGARSFDDYLLSMNKAQTQVSNSPQATGAVPTSGVLGDPFGLMASAVSMPSATVSPVAASHPVPPPSLQRAYTTDYLVSANHGSLSGDNTNNNYSSGGNPFALFAKSSTVHGSTLPNHIQHQNPTMHLMTSTSSASTTMAMDPFGTMGGIHQRQAVQQPTSSLAGSQDYFSAQGLNGAGSGHGSRSPNPFLMAAEGNGAQSRPGVPQAAPAFMRSMSESVTVGGGYNGSMFGLGPVQTPSMATGATLNPGFENAFSVPSRSMTLPPTSTMAAGGSVNMNTNMNMNMNMNMNGAMFGDAFGSSTATMATNLSTTNTTTTSAAWQRTLPSASATAASKYPAIDDLDPFSANASSSSSTAAAAAANAFSNPFSLHT